jgi:heme exporter protein C
MSTTASERGTGMALDRGTDRVVTGSAGTTADAPQTAQGVGQAARDSVRQGVPGSARRTRQQRVVRWLGITAAVSLVATVWLGLWVTPPDRSQGNLVRLLYLHPPIAWVALYLAFGLAALSSLLYLWRRTRSFFWDRLAASAVEIGVVFNALTLLTGSLWGRPTWGVWWTWDARLTSTALLLVLFLGYLALRRVPADPEVRAKRCAVAALIAFVDVPIVHFSVVWWQTLHQGATVLNANLSPAVHGSMAWTLLLGFVAMTLLFAWMVAVRYRIEVLTDELEGEELEISLAERRAEGTVPSQVHQGTVPSQMHEGADQP